MYLVADPDAVQPLGRRRGGPARHDEAHRGAVDQRQVLSVQLEGDQRVLFHRLGDRYAARDRRLVGFAGQRRVGTVMAGVDRRGFEAGRLQHVGQAYAGPLRAAGAAVGPLVAARLGREERAPVAAAFQHELVGDVGKTAHQLADREFERRVHLAIDLDLPRLGIAGDVRHLPIVAHEQLVRGRDGIVHQLGLGLGDQGLVAQHREAGLAFHLEKFRPLGRGGRRSLGQRRPDGRQRSTDCGHSDPFQYIAT